MHGYLVTQTDVGHADVAHDDVAAVGVEGVTDEEDALGRIPQDHIGHGQGGGVRVQGSQGRQSALLGLQELCGGTLQSLKYDFGMKS